ncbi:MAG: hypothetical protein JW929_12230 [Anaerolineales bacterium]|nr:hypothetical protein [Anaerolineales bacterium]
MLLELSDRLRAWADGRLILAVLAAFILLVNLPLFDPELVAASLDGRFAYTPEQAFAAVASYGEAGRVQMLLLHLADFLLIAGYTLLLSLTVSWLFRRGFKPESGLQRGNLVPVLGGLFDLMENIWIMILIWAFPARPAIVAWLATIFTSGKYLMGVPILLVLLIGLVKGAVNKFKIQEAGPAGG